VRNDDAVIRFAGFRLRPAQRQLTRDGAAVPLGARAMDLLLHLTAHAGVIVSKQALMQAVWPGRFVEENNLTVNMAALRRALGNAPDGQPMIQTVTGRGYVFVAGSIVDSPAAKPVSMPASLAGVPQPPTRLIGRDAALAELRPLLRTRRVVSIVGPGGVGKTTLALHLAAELAPEFADGVAFADLSSITDPARVPEAVAAVLAGGAGTNTATDRLTALLRDRNSLLLLDNCEHVVEPVAALVNAIVAGCPGVVILVTSREGLFLNEEQIFRLPPLPFPEDPQKADAASALNYGAVRLFVERAEAMAGAGGGFTFDDASAPIVAAICARLDGIPLAIEMAVPRLKVLSPAQLAERLGERFRLLAAPGRGATPRHRTLQAMIDWSYDFLPLQEQSLLRALSTFSGGASLAAIQAVAGGTDDVDLLDRLTGLADKSLLTVDPASGAGPRFRLLETVRQYAARKAADVGETFLQARHATYFAERFAEAGRNWPTTPGREWLAAYAADVENLRSALAWAFGPEGDAEAGLRLVASAVPLWWELPDTPVAEGQRWLVAAAQRLRPETPAAVQGWVRFGQSWRDFRFSDRENAQGALDAAALFRAAGEAAGLGAALWRAGSALLTQETMDQAEAHLVEAESVLRDIAPGKWLALTLIRLGDLRFRQGQHVPALAHYQEGFALSRTTDFWIGLVNGGSNMTELMLTNGEAERAIHQLEDLRDELPPSRRTPLMSTLAAHLLVAGDTPGMRKVAREAINQGSAIGLRAAVAWTVETVALLAASEGNIETAARLAGYARVVHPSIATRTGAHRIVADRLYKLLAAGLSPEALNLALVEGGRWPPATAANQARSVLGQEPSRAD
jgi:predicted ATPase